MDDNDGNRQMQFQQHGCPSSGINTFPGIPLMGLAADCFYGPPCTGLDPIGSLNLSEPLGVPSSSSSSMTARGGFASTIHPSDSIELDGRGLTNGNLLHRLARFPSDSNLAHMLQKLPVLGGGGFPEMGNPFMRNSGPVCAQNQLYAATERMTTPVQEECQSSVERAAMAAASSPTNGKRKRDVGPTSPMLNPTVKKAGGDSQRLASGETSDSKESAEKKQKMGENANNNKQTGKQEAKDNSPSREAVKDNYVHVRARRGQATNSHSLAERVRREKISERMKLLQELVPGCNKITGKALMLDEIINYVQSLQQQVEFLSMKLATVNPELNFDVDQILSKDVLHSRASNTPVFGFTPGINSPHPFPLGLHQSLPSIHNSTPPYHSMTQALWDGELQSLLSMDFNANPASGNLGPNGTSKTEL